jgi:dipeptidyl aminopeptidase/acylaminoacyl peptidase
MKKTVVVFIVVGVVLFGACAQKAEAQSANIAQKIVGTWVEPDGTTWVFNANGNLTMGGKEYKYAVTDTKFVSIPRIVAYGFFDISISSDGKTLILTYSESGYLHGYWLTKK